MFRAESIAWIGEPTPPGTIRPFKRKDSEITYWMREEDYDIYLVEKELLKQLGTAVESADRRRELIEAIEKYGQTHYDQGRHDESECHVLD